MDILFRMGATIVSILIRSKLGGDKCDNYIDIVTTFKELGLKLGEARQVNRSFEKIGDSIAEACCKILEKSNVQEERRVFIVEYVLKAYDALNMQYQDMLDFIDKEDVLRNRLLHVDWEYKVSLDPIEIECFERLIDYTVHFVVNASIEMPQFTSAGIRRLVSMMDELVDKIDDIVEQLDKVNVLVEDKTVKIRNFERYYRNKIINKYSYISLFGAGGLEKEYKKYKLDIAYVQLEIGYGNEEKSISSDQIFKKSKNIWLTGEAGSGKTTLLQWLAVSAAGNNQEIEGLRDSIPILIELRKTTGFQDGLKGYFLSIMKDSSYEVPEGWIEDSIETGRFLFLIDGFDEVDEATREKTLSWLQEIDDEDRCKKVFASRPQVKERPQQHKLLETRILPMNRKRIEDFIMYWHNAVLAEQLQIDSKDVKHFSFKLYDRINQSEPLRKLASNPLLCAMICALHHRNDMNLPLSKRELYEECCKLLLERRDTEREIAMPNVALDYEHKKIIMAQLAYWMMKNNYVEIDRRQAEDSVKRSIGGMSIGNSDEKVVFKYLLDRSGLLREPEINKIDFVHRTFQEYLTAYEISRQEDWGYLKEKVGDNTWEETIGMSIGYAHKDIASDIIEYTLNKGNGGREKKYFFLAITYLAGAIEVKESLRNEIETKVKELIPPMGEACYSLAEAGDLVVPYLVCKSEYNEEERLGCLLVLRLVGTKKALEVAKDYFAYCLTKAEVRQLGNLVQKFSDKELSQLDIPRYIKQYIEETCNSQAVLHDAFIPVIDRYVKDEIFYKINHLCIVDYQKSCFEQSENLFQNVESLEIEGGFSELRILKDFKNLKKLQLYCQSDLFSIYSLNGYKNIYNVQEVAIVLWRNEYVNGKDLAFLHNCKFLRLILVDELSEFYLDHFDEMKMLETLEIGGNFVLEIDFSYLPSSIKQLVLYVPSTLMEYSKAVRDELSVRTKIRCFEEIVIEMQL